MTVEAAKALCEEHGYVVIKAKSYRAAQERQRIAQIRLEDSQERVASIDAWARAGYDELRRLRDRLTFVYGVARAFGASVEDLTQHDLPPAGEGV